GRDADSRRPARAASGVQTLALRDVVGEDWSALALLLAPFLLVALSLGMERSVRPFLQHIPEQVVASKAPEPSSALPASNPASQGAMSPPRVLPRLALLVEPPPPVLPRLALLVEPPPPVLPRLALLVEPPPPVLPRLALLVEPPPPVLPRLALLVEPPPPVLPHLALLVEPPPLVLPRLALLVERPPPVLPPLTLLSRAEEPTALCMASNAILAARRVRALPPRPLFADGSEFGEALAKAASKQLNKLVIYNARYQTIAYPMGDVAPLFGVCTDVIVRAYRELGIDLQALIYKARVGGGDRNIDHRRVTVMSRFLARYGQSLPVTSLAEDYMPGDVVTYYRPQNRTTTTHIAIVSNVMAPSGRFMIIHNRGWGPQLEDALFVDKITGHYRYQGPKSELMRQASTESQTRPRR
ncbi:MAG: DUF1287 domain-containing protein, partial [Hyphomicrobiaceae bacterium]